ncbi:MAG TPA: hypothetical protein VFQ50_11715, partial [Flavobacterium sp.]|nr:hypothetical protein [Flavobacterium sp.]
VFEYFRYFYVLQMKPEHPMKKALSSLFTQLLFLLLMLSQPLLAQDTVPDTVKQKSRFWERVQFGGNLGLAIGNGYTDITVAPGAIYNVNEMFAVGAGLQYSYINQRDFFASHLYGGSLIALFNPIQQIQLSAEVEQLRVNADFDEYGAAPAYSEDFWNTGLFVGAGYRAGNVTIGGRYNLLFKQDRGVYSNAFMPFVRVYF